VFPDLGLSNRILPVSTASTLSSFPPRVLVVEDEPKTRESVAEGLRLEALSVTTAASVGEVAIAWRAMCSI
jgi:hypothetical protein